MAIEIRSLTAAWCACLGLSLGCGADAPLNGETIDQPQAGGGLQFGDRGQAVLEVQQYLTAYGYFPNEDLAAKYADWRPVTDTLPVAGVFDEVTERGVLSFQRNFGLEQSGVVDFATRELLTAHRCGVPDNIDSLDLSNKFDLVSKLTDTNISWRLTNTDDGIAQATARAAVASALLTWHDATLLTFTQDNSTNPVDITLNFADLGVNGPVAQCPSGAALPKTCVFNTLFVWSIGAQANKYDFQSIATHELGHALGFGHTGFPDSTMWPNPSTFNTTWRSLTRNDQVAGAVQYRGWRQVPTGGSATDIGATNSDRWIIGTVNKPGGKEVFKSDSLAGQWVKDTTAAGSRITVQAGGRPWVTTSINTIYRRKTSAITDLSGWDLMPGTATDIGASPFLGDAVWKIGTTAMAGGYDIAGWDPATNQWRPDASGGSGVRIAVDVTGRPWVVTSVGTIYRRNGNNPQLNVGWTLQGGGALAFDIAVWDAAHPVIVSRTVAPGGYRILVRNEQPYVAPPAGFPLGNAPLRDEWVWHSGGGGLQVAAQSNPAAATVVNVANQIYETK